MLIEIYLVLFLIAVYFLKLGLIDRKAEAFSFMFSFVLFALLTVDSYHLQTVTDSGIETIPDGGMFVLNVLLASISILMALLSVLGKLPEGTTDEFRNLR